jgi:hypothetical protein
MVFLVHKKFEKVVETQQKFFSARIECGKLLLELKARIEAGEAGDVRWWDWYGQRFARSRGDAEKVMALAAADDPQATYEQAKAANRKANVEYRERRRSQEQTAVPLTVSGKNNAIKSKTTPTLKVVEPEEEPKEPEIRDALIERAIDLVRQMTRSERLRFVFRLKSVYRE